MSSIQPNTVYLAAFKGKGNLFNWLIRRRSKSIYSHCEVYIDGMVMSTNWGESVRARRIVNQYNWDLFAVPTVATSQVLNHFQQTKGARYDYVGAVLGAGFGMNLQSTSRYHCAEWCARALGLSSGYKNTPQDVLTAALAKLSAIRQPWP